MNRPLIYLAGPIANLSYDEATVWRVEASYRLAQAGITTCSPMRGKEHLKGMHALDRDPEVLLAHSRAIFQRDSHDVLRADALLVHLSATEKASIGTAVELGIAWALRKPIVTVLEGGVHDHPFVREASSLVVPTLEEAVELLIAFFAVDKVE